MSFITEGETRILTAENKRLKEKKETETLKKEVERLIKEKVILVEQVAFLKSKLKQVGKDIKFERQRLQYALTMVPGG